MIMKNRTTLARIESAMTMPQKMRQPLLLRGGTGGGGGGGAICEA